MRNNRIICLALLMACLLCGCRVRTAQELYCLPKRSQAYQDLQKAIDRSMSGLEFCAPLSGENRQTVQQADLNGDGQPEYLLFAKGAGELPLKILVFARKDDHFALHQTIESNGTAFDMVEYAQIDGKAGMELVVGSQLHDRVLRSAAVYSFGGDQLQQLIVTPYTQYLTTDLDLNGSRELMVLRPGAAETQNGVAELFGVRDGVVEKSLEAALSAPVEDLKRIITGKLHGGKPAVFVGSSVEQDAIITDIYTLKDGNFTNISLSAEAGTSVQTLRNYYVYAEDIDADGEVELPDLINMLPLNALQGAGQHHLIRWYAMGPDGSQCTKRYTFHNYVDGWYLELRQDWASQITVVQEEHAYSFYLWDESYTAAEKVFSVYVFSGQDRETQAIANNRFLLHKSENAVYAARMEVASGALEITQADLIKSFHLIYQAWNTGEM